MSINIWWFIGPVLYLAAGWLFVYSMARSAVNSRKKCRECGPNPHHRGWNCDCTICTQRLYVCDDHDTDVRAWHVLAWPGVLLITLWWITSDLVKALWKKYNPGVVVERQIEKKRMTVLIRSKREEEDVS